MGNLSQFMPDGLKTVDAIMEMWKKRGDSEPKRGYLGASIIGQECDRALWYTFRGCSTPSFDGRMYRLFDRGHREEAAFVKELRDIGCTVQDCDENGNQFAVSACGGHFSGHMDAVALGLPDAPKTWHLCEFKTHNDKSFEKLKQVGVKKSKPTHYAQMQVYMGLGELERALYLAVNKDTDELYGERLEYDASEFKAIMARAKRIITAAQPPERIATRQDDFRCKFCDAQSICWGGETAFPVKVKTCRTCCHATPELDGENGRWICERQQIDLLPRMQQAACSFHLIIPGLLLFSKVVDAGDTWIQFEDGHGFRWTHGNRAGEGDWITEELMRTPAKMVLDPVVNKTRVLFAGTVTDTEPRDLVVNTPRYSSPEPVTDTEPRNLLECYPPEDSRLKWEGTPDDWNKIGESMIAGLKVTAMHTDATHQCVVFDDRLLLVTYKADNYMALWEGVE